MDCPLACFVDLQLTPDKLLHFSDFLQWPIIPKPSTSVYQTLPETKVPTLFQGSKEPGVPGVPQETNFFRRTFIPEEWWSKPAGISSAIRGCSSNRRQCHVATLVHPWHSRILGSYPKIAWIYGCLSLPSYSHSILVKCLKPTSKDK